MTVEEKCYSQPVDAQTLTPTTSPDVDFWDNVIWDSKPLSLKRYYIDLDAALDETPT